MRKIKTKMRDIAYISVGAVLISLCAMITVPATPPFTMQIFGVYSVLGIIGGKRGTASVFVYILLGLVGLPVFSGFGGGVGVIAGPTGGYIIGLAVVGILYAVTEKLCERQYFIKYTVYFIGLMLCYTAGTLWYSRIVGVGFVQGVMVCVLPFVLPDVVKIIIADIVSKESKELFRVDANLSAAE